MTGDSEIVARRVVVRGRVQGVGFRAWTIRMARAKGLAGFVRNRPDGAVEGVFVGATRDVETAIEACWRGPDLARVADLEIGPVDAATLAGIGPGFEQR